MNMCASNEKGLSVNSFLGKKNKIRTGKIMKRKKIKSKAKY